MSENTKIKYLKHGEADDRKWDHCIAEAPNSRVYAASWYLDRTAGIWDALVWGDYRFVMPLPYRQKFGIRYLYQPYFCQQLGIFPAPPENIAKEFYQTAMNRFSYSDLPVNTSVSPPEDFREARFQPRKNYLLPLNQNYEILSSGYSENTKRNINKAHKQRLTFLREISTKQYLEFIMEHQKYKLTKNNLRDFKNILTFTRLKGCGQVAGVYSPGNQLCAAAFFCRWKERMIYLNPVSSTEGKSARAMFFLIDQIIQTNAESNLTLDFEGSMVPGIARFFEGFGATPETYYQLTFNRLPFLLRQIKKATE